MDEIKHFTDYPEDEQASYAKEVTEKFKNHGFEVKSVEPLNGFFGKYNCIAYIKHPAFVSGIATVALFDGICGKVKIYTGLRMLYGGLSFNENLTYYSKDCDELDEDLHQLMLIIKTIRNEPMDIESRRKRGESE